MDNNLKNLEYNVLGYQVKFKPDDIDTDDASSKEVVDLVLKEASRIQNSAPHLQNGEVAVLVALKLASEKLNLNNEYMTNIGDLKKAAQDALQFVESSISH